MKSREIDVLIATKVMGWKPTEHPDKFTFDGGEYHIQDWSTDIKAAWEIVEKLSKNTVSFMLEQDFVDQNDLWFARFVVCVDEDQNTNECEAEAQCPAMAICLAALETVGVEGE